MRTFINDSDTSLLRALNPNNPTSRIKQGRSFLRDLIRLMTLIGMIAPLNTASFAAGVKTPARAILDPTQFQHYFNEFYLEEQEMLGSAPPLPWDWFAKNIPLLDVPDKEIEKIYYFRWYSFQKHIRQTPNGPIIDEFLVDVPWAGKFNSINMAAEFHIREARWLRDRQYVKSDVKFWNGPDGEPRRYSLALADAVQEEYLVEGDREFTIQFLQSLQANFENWEKTHQDSNGLFWQIDDRDGMEDSIGGSGYRPTINSYMYGDAVAVASIAELADETAIAQQYKDKAATIRGHIENQLWNSDAKFYESVTRGANSGWANVRELIGYVPWYFQIPSSTHLIAWKQLFDPQGFAGSFGPTTAERRSPRFGFAFPHECLWNGPSWPFATTQTLVALANVLNGPEQDVVSVDDYLRLLKTYAHSQRIRLPNGSYIPWIDENLDPDTGEWISRNILEAAHQSPPNRGRYYNHSGFADLIITGLIGLRPSAGNSFILHPLVNPVKWRYFAVDRIPYHGHMLSILYDRDGHRYGRGAGTTVLSDGLIVAHSPNLKTLHVVLPEHQ